MRVHIFVNKKCLNVNEKMLKELNIVECGGHTNSLGDVFQRSVTKLFCLVSSFIYLLVACIYLFVVFSLFRQVFSAM